MVRFNMLKPDFLCDDVSLLVENVFELTVCIECWGW